MMADEGAEVLAVDIDADALATLNSLNTFVADLTDEASVSALADRARDMGPLHILVNAAAVVVFGWIDELSFKDWRKTLAAEVDSVFLVTHAVWPLLKAEGGSIINFSSASGPCRVGRLASHRTYGRQGRCAFHDPPARHGRRPPRHPSQHNCAGVHSDGRNRAASGQSGHDGVGEIETDDRPSGSNARYRLPCDLPWLGREWLRPPVPISASTVAQRRGDILFPFEQIDAPKGQSLTTNYRSDLSKR